MEYFIESTKTNAGTRKIPMTEEVFRCFQAILEDREAPQVENDQDGGSRVGSERAGEAEWGKRGEGKTEQEDVQSGLNKESCAHRHNGGGRFSV